MEVFNLDHLIFTGIEGFYILFIMFRKSSKSIIGQLAPKNLFYLLLIAIDEDLTTLMLSINVESAR